MTDPNAPATPPIPQPYGAPYGSAPVAPYSAVPMGPPTNILAILALIAVFVFAPAAIVLGHIALGQIKRTGEAGHGLALWGMILGYVITGLGLLGVLLWLGIMMFAISMVAASATLG